MVGAGMSEREGGGQSAPFLYRYQQVAILGHHASRRHSFYQSCGPESTLLMLLGSLVLSCSQS